MPYRINHSYSNHYYHVYNRGNNRSEIFFEKRNYLYFMEKIKSNFVNTIDLIAFCLMPNHFHLLVKISEDDSLEKAMQKISTGYTRAINKAYGRTGHLFEGRYRNKIIPSDEYLIHLCRYIHLNPVRANLVTMIEQWEFSSYLDYIGKRDNSLVNKETISNYFNSVESLIEFHQTYQENQNYFVNDLLFH